MSAARAGDALRGILLAVLLAIMATSFVYGFGAAISQTWPTVSGERVGDAQTVRLMPALGERAAGLGLRDGVHASWVRYAYRVGDGRYEVPHLIFTDAPERRVEVHYLSWWPQLAYAAVGSPWLSLAVIPLLCVLLGLWLVRSSRVSRLLDASAPARARLAARRPQMR